MQPHFVLQGLWHPASADSVPAQYQRWLLEAGSLTALLRKHCQHFSLQLVSERSTSLPHEWQQHWQQEAALCREVILVCDGTPVVYAQSWLPLATLHELQYLARLGDQPLGDVIFQHPSLQRGPIEVAFWPELALPQLGVQQQLWGRRSVFSLLQQPLLVQEVFLPGVQDL
ncbi:chorismate lyase [Rheinheimera sp.]|uniref:chorismate--pyruvate lyase family protein n=1 Tax=Rheinheimera sp. TaxID=1869214 RepID=UPI00307E239A